MSTPLLTPEEIWRRYDAIEVKLTASFSERMLDPADLGAGMRVPDLATGRGEPALRAARRVGPGGHVVGIEPSEGVLQIARELAAREGLTNLDLRVSPAESFHDLDGGTFDAATSRWGLMYMTNPVQALTNARRALRSDGVLVAALWAEPERVGYHTFPRKVLARFSPVPSPGPDEPGVFRYADPARIVQDFAQAGLTVDHVEEHDLTVFEADTEDEIVAWVHAFGMARLLNDLPAPVQVAWERAFRSELRSTHTGGPFRLGGVSRLVRARPTPSFPRAAT